jgi:hypothetical protein
MRAVISLMCAYGSEMDRSSIYTVLVSVRLQVIEYSRTILTFTSRSIIYYLTKLHIDNRKDHSRNVIS